MRIRILASGSRGNAILIESRTTTIMVDAGISRRALRQRLAAAGAAIPERIDGLIVTHGHGDHAAHAAAMKASFGGRIHATAATRRSRFLRNEAGVVIIASDMPFAIGDIHCRPMAVPHDAPQVALVFEWEGRRVGLATDLGSAPPGLAAHFDDCDLLMLELNHDRGMLERGPYPAHLKARIAGERGHLENRQAADLLDAIPCRPRRVVAMHLSERNNDPSLVATALRQALPPSVACSIATQLDPLTPFDTVGQSDGKRAWSAPTATTAADAPAGRDEPSPSSPTC